MILALGYAALVLNVVGNLLLAHKRLSGWIIRLLTNAAWIAYAVQIQDGTPMAANHLIFVGINLYGFWRWHKSAPREDTR